MKSDASWSAQPCGLMNFSRDAIIHLCSWGVKFALDNERRRRCRLRPRHHQAWKNPNQTSPTRHSSTRTARRWKSAKWIVACRARCRPYPLWIHALHAPDAELLLELRFRFTGFLPCERFREQSADFFSVLKFHPISEHCRSNKQSLNSSLQR